MLAQDIDFLIIGAAKSATTWLQKSLQAAPGIVMPDPELHFFSRHFHLGEDWYLSQFPPVETALRVGEKSNSYLDDPEAARRVHALLPHAKLIVQLRNPVDRAYSDYCMLYRRGEVGGDIAEYLSPRRASFRRFLESGLYHQQVAAYSALYPPDQILVLLYEDMLSDGEEQLRRVGTFLGIEDLAIPPVRDKVKDRTEPMMGPTLRRTMRPLKPLAAPFRQTSLFKALRRWMVSEISYPSLSPALRAGLEDFYQTDVASLGRFLGRDLSDWLCPPERRAMGRLSRS